MKNMENIIKTIPVVEIDKPCMLFYNVNQSKRINE